MTLLSPKVKQIYIIVKKKEAHNTTHVRICRFSMIKDTNYNKVGVNIVKMTLHNDTQ